MVRTRKGINANSEYPSALLSPLSRMCVLIPPPILPDFIFIRKHCQVRVENLPISKVPHCVKVKNDKLKMSTDPKAI